MKKKWLYFDSKNKLLNTLPITAEVPFALENFNWKIKKKSTEFETAGSKWHAILNLLLTLDLSPIFNWHLTEDLPGYYLALDHSGNIFIDNFFFQVITNSTQSEIITYLIYWYVSQQQLLSDLEIECFQLEKKFLAQRIFFSKKEYQTLYHDIFSNDTNNKRHRLALIFVLQIHYPDLTKISAIEKALLREKIGQQEIKTILGLDDDDYQYMEKSSLSSSQVVQAEKISQVIEGEQTTLENYVSSNLKNKKIILWSWWTASPFLTKDISLLLNLLVQYKSIKKIYIDLPQNIDSQIQNYLQNKTTEEEIEKYIKQIYPEFLKDYHKEITPYLIFLDRVKNFFQTVLNQNNLHSTKKKSASDCLLNCFGLSAKETLEYLPLVNKENQIYFEIEENWHQLFLKEWQSTQTYSENEIVLFIQTLKPMFYLPNYFHNLPADNVLEKLLHADKFTGFGPKKPCNFLATYSQYYGYKKNSFILTNLRNYFFANDVILPLNDTKKLLSSSMQIDDSRFNYFYLYDTLLYSNQHDDQNYSEMHIEPKKDLVFT